MILLKFVFIQKPKLRVLISHKNISLILNVSNLKKNILFLNSHKINYYDKQLHFNMTTNLSQENLQYI